MEAIDYKLRLEQTVSLLTPYNDVELGILSKPEVMDGLWWGKPRGGHPEGEVVKHVAFILDNINKLCLDEIMSAECTTKVKMAAAPRQSMLWRQLRLIAILHDTFKYQVDTTKSKDGENHHAMRARRYAEQNFKCHYTEDMLDVLELHDEAYNSWCKGSRDNKWDKAESRAHKLIDRIRGNLELYLCFFACDTHVGDDNPAFDWFKKLVYKSINS